ncbi:MAG: hypothetical protein ACR2FN_00175 [Chitinophagaceae bacterium]
MKKSIQILGVFLFVAILFISCKKDISPTQQTKQTGTLLTQNSFNLSTRAETQPPIQTEVQTRVNANIGGYIETLPYGYDSHKANGYPLLIALTGTGGLGNGTTDLYKVEICNAVQNLIKHQHFPASFSVNGNNYSFIVISPQFKAWPQSSDVNDMIDYAISHYNIDATRIYVCGQSMGGGNTWDYAIDYGARLAAIVPICGASYPTTDKAKKIAQADVAVWAFHNSGDKSVPSWYSVDYVTWINSYNPLIPAKLTLWQTAGHNAWTEACDPAYTENGMNIYEWMLNYKKN